MPRKNVSDIIEIIQDTKFNINQKNSHELEKTLLKKTIKKQKIKNEILNITEPIDINNSLPEVNNENIIKLNKKEIDKSKKEIDNRKKKYKKKEINDKQLVTKENSEKIDIITKENSEKLDIILEENSKKLDIILEENENYNNQNNTENNQTIKENILNCKDENNIEIIVDNKILIENDENKNTNVDELYIDNKKKHKIIKNDKIEWVNHEHRKEQTIEYLKKKKDYIDENKYIKLNKEVFSNYTDSDLTCLLFTRLKQNGNLLSKEVLHIHRNLLNIESSKSSIKKEKYSSKYNNSNYIKKN